MPTITQEQYVSKVRERKQQSGKIGKKFEVAQEHGRSERIHQCATWFRFLVCKTDSKYKLRRSNFCRDRMCPMCQNRLSLKTGEEIRQVGHHIRRDYPSYKYILLTLTAPNCTKEALPSTLTHFFKSWKRLLDRAKVKKVVKGWFRGLEVTYNADADTYHPHIHALILVQSNYFTKNFITQASWLQLWRESYRDQSITQVDVRRLYANKKQKDRVSSDEKKIRVSSLDLHGSEVDSVAGEVAKYCCKPGEILNEELTEDQQQEVFETLYTSLKGRRIHAFGLLLRDYKKRLDQLRIKETEERGLEPLNECSCELCGEQMREYIANWTGLDYFVGRGQTPDVLETRSQKRRKSIAPILKRSPESKEAARKARITRPYTPPFELP